MALAVVLVASAAAKGSARTDGPAALASFGLRDARLRGGLWWALVAGELAVAGALLADAPGAWAAAAALLAAFAVAVAAALLAGRRGSPCGCFGRRSRLGPLTLLRAAGLAVAAALVPLLDGVRPGPTAWLAAGLVAALLAVAALAVAVLALAREVGELRLAVAPQAAVSIPGEGPELGARLALIDRFEPGARLALAFFSSPSCRLCRAVEPAVELAGESPGVAVAVFDEERDRDAWAELGIPGSPYAVVLAADGTVLAKGTFNTLPQLDGLVHEAERQLEAAVA